MWLNKIQNQNLYSLFFSIDIIFDLIVNERYVIFNYYRNNNASRRYYRGGKNKTIKNKL
jgi:hypothetical protein